MLTYAAVIPEPISSNQRLQSAPVHSRELARGTATGAPEAIDVEEVVEHALRHLAWLVREDKRIGEALGTDWREALAPYEPEPFSAFDLSGALSEEDGCLLCTRVHVPSHSLSPGSLR